MKYEIFCIVILYKFNIKNNNEKKYIHIFTIRIISDKFKTDILSSYYILIYFTFKNIYFNYENFKFPGEAGELAGLMRIFKKH